MNNKKYYSCCKKDNKEWSQSAMEKLEAEDWAEWIYDRLHRKDGLLCRDSIRDELVDVFLDWIPELSESMQRKALDGVVLASKRAQQSLEKSIGMSWQDEALTDLVSMNRWFFQVFQDEKIRISSISLSNIILNHEEQFKVTEFTSDSPVGQAKMLKEVALSISFCWYGTSSNDSEIYPQELKKAA